MTEAGDAQPPRAESSVGSAIADAAGIALLVHERAAEGWPAASRIGQWSWALFEAARDPNVIFQIYVISPFLVGTMMRDAVAGQELWSDITAWAGYLTALICPLFGAIADRGGPRKPWLAAFTVLMVLSFAGTWFGVPDSGTQALVLFSLAMVVNNTVFELSNAFHGAMLSTIAPHGRMGALSGLAYALGSGAGFVLMALFLVLFVLPGAPLDLPGHMAERLAGPISAVWMALFAVPLFLFTPDRAPSDLPLTQAVRAGIAAVIATFRSLGKYRNVAHYIGARTLFNDGLTGVLVYSGIYAAGVFHLDTLAMTAFGLLIVFSAAMGGFFGGWLDTRLGSKRALLVTVGGTALCFGLTLTMGPDRILWFLHYAPNAIPASPIALFATLPRLVFIVLSCVNALCVVGAYANSRTMLARIAPLPKMTEFFGLMSLSGTAATFLAPVSVKIATRLSHDQRIGLIPIVMLLAAGWLWMLKVREERSA
ncbi:MAG: MFS transporter [Alphaproteobacteria bacterium]|nr:MFS transporter [Alphaproteobacteria bacterium]MBV9693213.1 MFS transporter [Alphaproteobacteria bacterium]